ncbi:unnamed protein product [Durusdinium trenchii]|uniref:Uncharacterized protein n=1 Tax=Durusdinium trenchii TaxID=1381693 RepID=A0ABP0QTU6_9DINO
MLCLRWLISVAVAVLNTQQLDQGLKEAMEVIVSSARLGVRWFDLVYQHGLWLSPSCGACLYEVGVGFVDGYAKLFAYAWATQQSLYALVPKYHFQLHTLHELHTQLSSGSLVICNPVHWDCSQNEDLIGRLSKLSRVADCRVASARAPPPAPAPAHALAEPAPAEPEAPEKDSLLGQDGTAGAVDLFRSFLSHGRDAQNWRKNDPWLECFKVLGYLSLTVLATFVDWGELRTEDLRLINNFVVPWLFGGDARIDWAHPVLALDQLEELTREAPEQLKLLGPAPKKSVQAPYAPVAAPTAPTTPNTMTPGSTPHARPPRPPRPQSPLEEGAPPAQPVARRCGTGDLPRRSKAPEENPRDLEKKKWKRNEKEVVLGAPRRRGCAAIRRTDFYCHVFQEESLDEAIRARREALEQARQDSLKMLGTARKALAKKEFGHREDWREEIAALEAQMGTASTYAAAGLKKRLQTLKAAALREDRAAQVTCCTILGDRLKIQEELQELCRGAANGDFIHLAAPEAPVEVPVEVPVLPVAPAPLPLTTLVPAPVPMPVGPENAGFQWQASSEKLLYSRLTNEVNFDDWMPPNLDEHVTLRLHHALQTGYLSKERNGCEEQQPLWKSLQQLVDHQPEEQRLVIQKRLVGREELSGGSVGRAATVECRGEGTKDDLNRFLGPTYDDFREIVNKPMWLLRCIEHCRRSSRLALGPWARSERVTATVNNERLWAALDGHGLGESDLTEECWNTFGLFPPPLQETVLEAVRQSLLLKTEKNPSRFFTELCVNEEAVYNLEARRGDADEAVQVQPAQGTWESFSDSRYHELLRQLLLNTRNAEHQVLQVLSEEKPDLPGSSGLLQVHLATQDARREGSAELLSLLHAAAANGLARLCARLIAEGFDVNERTGHQLFSPLHLAASNGVLAATELLLAKGAQAWLLDDSGKTPLYHVVTTLPEAKASEQQLLLRIAQQLVLGMLQASEMDELLVESALEILQQRKNQQIFTPPKLAELGRMSPGF